MARLRGQRDPRARPRRPGPGDPGRCLASPGDLERRLRLVLVPRVAPRRAEVARCRCGGLRPARPAHAPAGHAGARAGPRTAAPPRRPRRSLRVPDRPVQLRHRHQPGSVQPVTARRGDGVPPRPRRRAAVFRQAASHQGPAVLAQRSARHGRRNHYRERRPAAQAVRPAASPRARLCGNGRRDARPLAT
jgi:hypothetical protein